MKRPTTVLVPPISPPKEKNQEQRKLNKRFRKDEVWLLLQLSSRIGFVEGAQCCAFRNGDLSDKSIESFGTD